MVLIKVIDDLKESLEASNILSNKVQTIKDVVKDLPKLRANIKGYIGWVAITKIGLSASEKSNIRLTVGVSGVSTTDDDDYLQVVAKCAAVLEFAFEQCSYVNDEDIEDFDIIVDSEEHNDTVINYLYTDIVIENSALYGK